MNDLPTTGLADEAKTQKERVASSMNGVAGQASQQRERAVDGAKQVADRFRERAGDAPGSEKAAEVVQGAAERMKASAGYVRERDYASMGNTIVNAVKNNPVKAAAVGAVGALLIILKLRSGSSDEHRDMEA